MKFLESGEDLLYAKFILAKVLKKMVVFLGVGTFCKKGDRHKGRGKFVKGGVETPLHTILRNVLIKEKINKSIHSIL